MKPLPQHDRRQEPLYPLDSFTAAMKACLLDIPAPGLLRTDKGYVGPSCFVHRKQVVDALEELGLCRRMVIIGTAGKQVRIYLTGEGAWAVRSLRRQP